MLQRGFWQLKFEDTGTHTAAYTAFSKTIHEKLMTHPDTPWLFLFFVTGCKTLRFASIVEFIVACPLCLHGSAVKIALCHEQSRNSPIAVY